MKNPRTQAWLTRPDGLATRMRAARGANSTRELGAALGWANSKVSRIESGKQVPTAEEVHAWAEATHVSDDEQERWQGLLEETLSMQSTFRRRIKASQAEVQGSFAEVEAVAVFLRTFQMSTVPTMLQSADYMRELFGLVEDFYAAGRDIDEAVAGRLRRQENLYDNSKRFEFILSEAALYNAPGRLEVMPAQLDLLVTRSALPNVRLGIIPFLRPLSWMPGPSGFTIYDADDAYTEGWTEDRRFAGSDVATLHRGMDRMWRDAVEGEQARELIIRAQDRLLAAQS